MDNITCENRIVDEITTILKEPHRHSSLKIAAVPDIIVKINNALSDNDVSIFDVAAIVQKDVALSARILRAANSPLLCKMPSATVKDAISYIGLSLVKSLAVCVLLKDQFKTNNPELSRVLASITHDTNDVTSVMYVLCKELTTLKGDVAFMMGLIHTVGKSVLLSYVNDHCTSEEIKLLNVDQLLQDHNIQIGKFVLARWGFPQTISDTVFSPLVDVDTLDDVHTYKHIFAAAKRYTNNEVDEVMKAQIDILLERHAPDLKEMMHPFV